MAKAKKSAKKRAKKSAKKSSKKRSSTTRKGRAKKGGAQRKTARKTQKRKNPHAGRQTPARLLAEAAKNGGVVEPVYGSVYWMQAKWLAKHGYATFNAKIGRLELNQRGRALARTFVRGNPARVDLSDGGRVLRPENCPVALSSALLRARKDAKGKHQRKPRRWGNCDYRSAEYVLSKGKYLVSRGITPGSNFKGHSKPGKHEGAKAVTGKGDAMVSWWWLPSA